MVVLGHRSSIWSEWSVLYCWSLCGIIIIIIIMQHLMCHVLVMRMANRRRDYAVSVTLDEGHYYFYFLLRRPMEK